MEILGSSSRIFVARRGAAQILNKRVEEDVGIRGRAFEKERKKSMSACLSMTVYLVCCVYPSDFFVACVTDK